MNKFLKQYINSFRFRKQFWHSLAIDIITVVVITFLFLSLGNILSAKAYAISDGKDVEQLKVDLLAGNIETNQAFLANVKSFSFYFFGGTILVILASLFLFSLSRAMLWSYLLKLKFSRKKYWKWNGITVILALFIIPYLLAYAVIRMVLNLFIPLQNSTAYFIYSSIFNFFFLLVFIVFMFLVYASFAREYKVWKSIGDAFELLKLHWKRLWKMFLFILLTGIIISLISFYLQKALRFQPEWLSAAVSIGLFLVFISWMRLYFVRGV